MARHGDRSIHPPGQPEAWMRNGTTGRITNVNPGAIADGDTVDVDTVSGVLTVPREVFDRPGGGIDLSYAVTSYAVQGSTRDVSTSVATAATSRRELYVDITRGRHDNKVYGTINAPPGDSDEHLPTLPRPLVEDLAIAVRKRTPPPVAVADPAALIVIQKRQGRSLAALLAAERRGEPGLYATIERVAATIRQHGEHQPPAQLNALLGPIPDSPHLAHRYRTIAGNLAVLHGATNTPRRRPCDVLEQALGVRPTERSAAVEWDELADQASQLAVDIAFHRLRDDPDVHRRPPWLVAYLHGCATTGQLADRDPAALADAINDLHDWRSAHDVPDSDLRPLGELRSDQGDRARHDELAARYLDIAMIDQARDRGAGIAI
jgi:hypothetical protein